MSDIAERLKHLNLNVYTATWCGDCTRLKRWLDEHGIAYQSTNIEEVDGAADKLVEETGKRAIPFVHVNDTTWVRGYHKEEPMRFVPEKLIEELLAAG